MDALPEFEVVRPTSVSDVIAALADIADMDDVLVF